MIKDAKPMKLQFVSQVEQLKYFVRRCIAALLVGVILMLAMFILNIAYEGADKKEKKVSNYLYQFRDASELLTFSVQSYVITGDKQYYDLYINELNVEKHRDDAISGLQDCHLKDDEMNAILSISDISNALAEVENKTFEAGNNNEWEKARQMVFDSNYLESVLEIKNKTADSISTITTRLNNNRRILKYIQIVFVILFVFSLWVLESHCRKTMKFSRVELLEPIVKVSDYMEQISKGDLSIPLDMKEDDSEVGHMVSAINKMRISNADIIREISMLLEQMGSGNYKIEVRCNYEGDYIQIKKSLIKISEDMKKIVSTIQDAAKDIGDGSSQLATVSDDLAQSCVTQASQLSDVMMLINTLEESINYNEKEAEEAAKISRSSKASLDVSTAKMEELKTAIGEIYKRSDEINEIVASIEEIASETDLLSLNAAIEAARAGEAGRGFSVVAEQVKKLSEESAEAARQTAQLIAITISAVEEGIRLADEAVTDTEEVLVGTQETTDRIDRVVEKLRLEVESMQQITDSINMVAGLVDNNSMTADETAMVSTQQRDQAGMLVDLVGQLEI